MAVTGQKAYYARILIGAKMFIMHPITCPLDIETGPNLINIYFLPPHYPPNITKSTAKTRYSASKNRLEILEHVSLKHLNWG